MCLITLALVRQRHATLYIMCYASELIIRWTFQTINEVQIYENPEISFISAVTNQEVL